MAEEKKAEEFIRVDQPWHVDYRVTAGPYGSRYLINIRDKGKLLAARCPKCQRWFMPPTMVCSVCHVRVPEYPRGWVELSGKGHLVYWEKVVTPMMNVLGELKPLTHLICTIQLDEGLGFGHLLDVAPDSDEEGKLKKGMRVELEMKPREERVGSPDDIKYFKVLWDEPVKEL